MSIENDSLRVTVLTEGGHIAEIFDKGQGVNPLWTPPGRRSSHGSYDRVQHPAYGSGVDASLLAGIMGHNLCLDIFGGPSPEEAAAGMPVHGEASIVRYDVQVTGSELVMQAHLPLANLRGRATHSSCTTARCESARPCENLAATDRAIGWTQHVTLGPAVPEEGRDAVPRVGHPVEGDRAGHSERPTTSCRAPSSTGRRRPRTGGGVADLSVFTNLPASSAFTTHLMDTRREHAFFVAFSPRARAGVRLRLAARRLSVARDLGGKPEPLARALERA